MTDREKLLERIQKLYAHATSARSIGSEAEALTFMAGVQKLLDKHNLSMSDVEFELEKSSDPIGEETIMDARRMGWTENKSRVYAWERTLVRATTNHFSCRVVWIQGYGNRFILIGRKENRQIAEYMLMILLRTANELADKTYNEAYAEAALFNDVGRVRGFRNSFVSGFAVRIDQRFKELRESLGELTAEQRKVAIIRLSSELTLAKQYVDNMAGITNFATPSPVLRNAAGVAAGIEAANNVNLNSTGVGSGPNTQPGRIAEQPRQLGSGS